MALSDTIKRAASFGLWKPKTPTVLPDGKAKASVTSEIGRIATPENSAKYLYQQQWINP